MVNCKRDANRSSIQVNGYRVGRILGKGGMSIVYRGERLTDGRPVALKVGNRGADDGVLEREYWILRGLQQEGIVQVLEYRKENDWQILILDYVEGEDLRRKLEREGVFSEEQIRDWGISLAGILSYLHERGILYLDLKPSNVMCLPDGSLRLVDFGAAVRMGENGKLGTKGYASPEQMKGGRVGEGSDRYSLGAMLFQLWTGELYRGSVPKKASFLTKILERCLSDEVGIRYRTDAELLRDLSEGKGRRRRSQRRSLFSVGVAGIFCLGIWGLYSVLGWQRHVTGDRVWEQLMEEADSDSLCLLFPEREEGYLLYIEGCLEDRVLDEREERRFFEMLERVSPGRKASCRQILQSEAAAWRAVCDKAAEAGMLYGSWSFAEAFLDEEAGERTMIGLRKRLLSQESAEYERYWELLMDWYQEMGEESVRRVLGEGALFFGEFPPEAREMLRGFWEMQGSEGANVTELEEWKLLEVLLQEE